MGFLEVPTFNIDTATEFNAEIDPAVLQNPNAPSAFETLTTPETEENIEFLDEHPDTSAPLSQDGTILWVYFANTEEHLSLSSRVLLRFEPQCMRVQRILRRTIVRTKKQIKKQ